eukprot:1657002-Alexandrium_andersonii.AAC.1
MEKHVRMADFIDLFTCFRRTIGMSSFGGDTLKHTWLYSGDKWALDEIMNFQAPKACPEAKEMIKKHFGICGTSTSCKA